MIEVRAKIRKWGRSFGVVIPKEMVLKERLKENETVKLLIVKPTNALRGCLKSLKSLELFYKNNISVQHLHFLIKESLNFS